MTKLQLFTNHFQLQFLYIVVFAAAFSILGYLLPQFYRAYLDKTEYYKIHSATVVQDKSYPCGAIQLRIHRTALVDFQGKQTNQLIELLKDESLVMIKEYNIPEFTINKGEAIVLRTFVLPCDLEVGEYSFRGSVSYSVDNVSKTVFYKTNQFQIIPKPAGAPKLERDAGVTDEVFPVQLQKVK